MLGGVNWKQVRPHRMHNAQNVKKRTIAIDVGGLSVCWSQPQALQNG